MSFRASHAKLANYIRAGVLCVDGVAARTCIAHGLPDVPDSFSFTPIARGSALGCVSGVFVESFDATSIVFVNSFTAAGTAVVGMLRMATEFQGIS